MADKKSVSKYVQELMYGSDLESIPLDEQARYLSSTRWEDRESIRPKLSGREPKLRGPHKNYAADNFTEKVNNQLLKAEGKDDIVELVKEIKAAKSRVPRPNEVDDPAKFQKLVMPDYTLESLELFLDKNKDDLSDEDRKKIEKTIASMRKEAE